MTKRNTPSLSWDVTEFGKITCLTKNIEVVENETSCGEELETVIKKNIFDRIVAKASDEW